MNVIHRRDSHGRRRLGFTLMEMLIVIFIILALGGIVLVNLLGTQEGAEKDIVRVQIQSFKQALDHFRVAMRRFPTEEEGLAVLWDKTRLQDEEGGADWRAFLSEPLAVDKWGNEWIYHQPSQLVEGGNYDIISPGPDKQEGTADDITNHDGKSGSSGDGGTDDFSDFRPASPTGR